jgi:hypothetical protein
MMIALVGITGGSHLGGSFARAAKAVGLSTVSMDASEAFEGPRLLRALSWRFAGRRPPRLHRFSKHVVETCLRAPPDILMALGTGFLTRSAVQRLRSSKVLCLTFSADDPWNRSLRANWQLSAIPAYDIVFTPRRANVNEFHALGCPVVHYLPFGYDEEFFGPPKQSESGETYDVLFVGGADADRVAFMAEFLKSGLRTALVGGYWDRYPVTRPHALGLLNPQQLRTMTSSAKVNLCLVRRANRDGHVMRSFEIAAAGGCMLAEDTGEHREIFGSDGESVIYFRTAEEAAERASWLVRQPAERARLAQSVRARVGVPENSYRARLMTMLEAATDLRAGRPH